MSNGETGETKEEMWHVLSEVPHHHPRQLSTLSEDLGTASRFSAMSRCETDEELTKMGRAMTIKVAMADAIGEESDMEEEREVRLPGHPSFHDQLQCISPDGSPVSLRKSADKTPEGRGRALVAVKDEDSEAEAVSPVVKGQQRKEWKLIATDELQQGEDLRRGAQRWLRAKDIPHKTLTI
eukprot:symbB.v1.2.033933.t1/scaffold4288.1/size41896/4